MRKVMLVGAVVAFGLAMSVTAEDAAAPVAPVAPKATVEVKAPACGASCAAAAACKVSTACYVCEACKACAPAAGKCTKCDKDMAAMHVLSVKDGVALLCACAADCKCKLNDDGTKCGCGKDVVKITLPAVKPAETK